MDHTLNRGQKQMKTENRKTDKEIKKQTVRQTNIKNGPHTEQRAKTDANRKTDIGRNKSQKIKFKRPKS